MIEITVWPDGRLTVHAPCQKYEQQAQGVVDRDEIWGILRRTVGDTAWLDTLDTEECAILAKYIFPALEKFMIRPLR